jgi:murein L,D-transpeptidase YafK
VLGIVALAGCAWDDELSRQQVAMIRPPAVAPAPPSPPRADLVEVFKGRRQMVLEQNGRVLKTYPIMLGLNPVGPKLRQGDKRTPEGEYFIDYRMPSSRFYRGLHISYPNAADIDAGQARGESDLGGDIFIHGMGFSPDAPAYVGSDWTYGCIAMTNDALDEVWQLVPDGTPIRIHP